MKIFSFVLTIALISLPATAQQIPKPILENKAPEKAILKAKKSLETARTVDSLVNAENFRFVATELRLRKGPTQQLRGFQYTSISPERMEARMFATQVEGFFLGETPYDKCELKNDRWKILIETDYQMGKMSFEFEIDRKTANAKLKVWTNRSSQAKTYVGYVLPN